jgi:phage/plasmid-like protein (TIGR03299 family)
MSHELEINEEGRAKMFYVGTLPWHGLGEKLEKEVTSAAAIRFAQLDWIVEKRPLTTPSHPSLDPLPVTTHVATVRTEDNKVLGIVGNNYEVIQNKEVFEFADALVGEGLTMYHTAGSLLGGKRIFICCKFPEGFEVGPDLVDKYMVLASGHDGGFALHVKMTPIRVVCMNTLSMALGDVTDTVAIKHTRNYLGKVEAARKTLGLANAYYKRMEVEMQKLIEKAMNDSQFTEFVNVLHPQTTEKRQNSLQEKLLDLFHDGAGNNQKDVRNTRWAALGAVTDYYDHFYTYRETKQSSKDDSHMLSTIWGSAAQHKAKALSLLLK